MEINPKAIKIIMIVLGAMFLLPVIIFFAIRNPKFLLVGLVLGGVLLVSLAESKGWI